MHRAPSGASAAGGWLLLSAAALIAGAWWLRMPEIRYLAATAVATGLAGLVAARMAGVARRWALSSVALLAVFTLVSLLAQRDISRITSNWPHHRDATVARGLALILEALHEEHTRLARLASDALEAVPATASEQEAFRALERLAVGDDRGVVLLSQDVAVAWAGRLHASPAAMRAAHGAVFTPFHTVVYAAADRDGRRAVAAQVIGAIPPADRLVHALDARVARAAGLRGFRFDPIPAALADARSEIFSAADEPLVGVLALPFGREEALLHAVERARSMGVVVLAVALLLLLVASWSVRVPLGWRLVPLAAALATLALLPLSAFSGATPLFDPTVYFAEFGGAFTANVGALMLVAAVVLLGVLLVLREPVRLRTPVPAILLVGAIVAGGPFLLRLLSRGVTPPVGGITAGLWLAWETALFLAAAALLVIVAAGSLVIRRSPAGLHPAVAPALAAVAALLGPVVMESTAGWPLWYALLWILALGALAFTRRHAYLVVTAAITAALGAATVTWNAGVRGRMTLAESDVASLHLVEPFLQPVLDRLADLLVEAPPPRTDAELLRAYVESDLEGTGFPVQLMTWGAEGAPVASLALAPLDVPNEELARLAAEVRARGSSAIVRLSGAIGAHVAMALPYPDGYVITVVVGPRSRLIPDAPFNALLGLAPRELGPPPYSLTLQPEPDAAPPAVPAFEWYRARGELHGAALVRNGDAAARAHVEVELRTLDVLVQRGTLVVLFNVLLIVLLWVVSTLPGGGLGRWLRLRLHAWRQSYRARLTVALFAFFVIPAAAFAAWSYQRLQSEDRQSRELLVRETLRALATGERVPEAGIGAAREVPLWVYREGEVAQTSAPVLATLAPTGRMLAPPIYLNLVSARELFASQTVEVAGRPVLFGFRSAVDLPEAPVVLGVPSRGNEQALEQRRRDLGILVLFATVIGAFGALWLSGVAARSLAEPIGRLRSAALAIAAGEREPPLAGEPPLEFRPVFTAFRRMATDLGESRAALEAAQRRTAAVLRNVASGVIAVREDGSIVLANPRAELLLEQSLLPHVPLPILAGADLADRARGFLARGDVEEEELDVHTGGDRQIHVRLTRLPGTGGAVITLDDVTELARAQRVLAWGEMARQVAHEIKNPLTPIRLGVQHLKRAHGDRRADFEQILDQNVGRILAEIDRLDEIARSFSRYGALPADRMRPVPTDVMAVARDVVELERMGTGSVEWQLSGADGELLAQARPDELREVLLNLLENARLAHATRVRVSVGVEDSRVRIEVEDDGRGIPADVLPRIFEPHFSTRTSGSGLGLAVSRQLVESWGGSIVITSNAGTNVRVELAAAG